MREHTRQQIEAAERAAELVIRKCDAEQGDYAFGHYFAWADVQVTQKNGKTKWYKTCLGSGCSANPSATTDALNSLPNYRNAFYNLD